MNFKYNERNDCYEAVSRRIKFLSKGKPDENLNAYAEALSKSFTDRKQQILDCIFDSEEYLENFDGCSRDEQAFKPKSVRLWSENEAEIIFEYKPWFGMVQQIIEEHGLADRPEEELEFIKSRIEKDTSKVYACFTGCFESITEVGVL